MGASLCSCSSWERRPAASSCSFPPQQQELAPRGRSYRGPYGFTISDSTTMSSSYANELPSAGGFLIV